MAAGLGYGMASIAVLCFGTNFIPVKNFETGDGMFFQWLMCMAIWTTGLVVQFARSSPAFEPIAVIGGVMWATGNLACVPIIQCIGMGLGVLIWGASCLVLGWASGNFGFFGITKNVVANPTLNYVGAAIALSSMLIMFFVKSGDDEKQKQRSKRVNRTPTGGGGEGVDPLVDDEEYDSEKGPTKDSGPERDGSRWTDKLSPSQKRLFGCFTAVAAGVLFGMNFDPPQYLISHAFDSEGKQIHSTDSLDYVFSHFTGIFAASTFWFLLYCLIKLTQKSDPQLFPKLVLPACASGWLWSFAQVAWFVANQELQFVVSFPIITTGPGLVAALWGIFMFKEITGTRNFLVLAGALSVTFLGVGLIAASN